MGKHDYIKSSRKGDTAVSEVFGTILLLVISVTLFSAVYANVLSVKVDSIRPSVNIIGTIEENILILEHKGGEPLSLNDLVILGLETGSTKQFEVGEKLPDDAKSNGLWDMGEKVEYNLADFKGFIRFDPLDVTVVDIKSNSVIMMGTLEEGRYADISVFIDMAEKELTPLVGENIDVNIHAQNLGPSVADGVVLDVTLPDGLRYIGHSGSGTYDVLTGAWNVGSLKLKETATLTLTLNAAVSKDVFTQLVFILDGSDAILDTEWTMITECIANAIMRGEIPNFGTVQLTIIQYGLTQDIVDPFTRVDISPTVITTDNYMDLVNRITQIKKVGGNFRPMAHGFKKATSTLLKDSPYAPYSSALDSQDSQLYYSKKIINLVPGANPNIIFTPANEPQLTSVPYAPWANVFAERDKMIQSLGMKINKDQIDVEAIMGGMAESNDLDLNILKNRVVFPLPTSLSSDTKAPYESGWVKEVYSRADFEAALDSLFKIAFTGKTVVAELVSTEYKDPNPSNNIAKVTILVRTT